MVEHFVSCESHWSHWDSLYTLSEEDLTSEEEEHRYQHYSRPQCHFCEVIYSCFLTMMVNKSNTKCHVGAQKSWSASL